MKKMVFMAAFVAATAAFVACSSNDDLVQQKPDVPEEQIEEGTPMTIIVSDLASRGNDFNSTTNLLTAFKLYSSLDSYWTAGKLMEYKNDNWTTNNSLSWPDEAEHTFFAINVADDDEFADFAENEGAGDDHPDLPVVTATTCSFNYKMPISVKPKADPGDADEYYYNSEDLKDLLVATTTGSSTTGDPAGSLTINFTHALAQITAIKVYCDSSKMRTVSGYDPVEDIPYWRFRIGGESIRVGGLKAVGTYTFGATTPWAVSGDDTEFEIPLNIPTNDATAFALMAFQPNNKTNAIILPLTDQGFYLIPQAVIGTVKKISAGYTVEGAYVELDAQLGHYSDPDDMENSFVWDFGADETTPVDWNAADSKKAGFKKIRVPLKFDISSTGVGKSFTLVLDISNAVIWEDGENRSQYNPIFGEGVDIKVG